MWNFLTIAISVSDGQIYDYKQLPSNTKIGDPTKTDRYCEVCQSYLPFSSLVWWYVILIVIIDFKNFKAIYTFVRVSTFSWCALHIYQPSMASWNQRAVELECNSWLQMAQWQVLYWFHPPKWANYEYWQLYRSLCKQGAGCMQCLIPSLHLFACCHCPSWNQQISHPEEL